MIADIFKVVIIDNQTQEVFGSTTMSTANVNFEMDTTDVNGGGELLAVLHNNKRQSIELEDVEHRYDILAKQLGANIVTGANVGYAMPKWYTVVDNASVLEIELDETPLTTGNLLKIYDKDGKAITGTLAGKKVTFATGVVEGDDVEVRTYKFATPSTTESIEINNKQFPKGVSVVLETLEIDTEENPINKLQYIFESAVFDGAVSIATATERNAVTHAMNLRIMKPKNKDVVGRVLRIPIGA